MEALIFIGIHATGKTTFYNQQFVNSHARISLDLMKTRHIEMVFIETCLKTGMKLVVDNTNPTIADRKRYIEKAKKAGFQVSGYYFESKLQAALDRNSGRDGKAQIPDKGILGTYKRLELPSYKEGFDKLYYVRITDDGTFDVQEYKDEI